MAIETKLNDRPTPESHTTRSDVFDRTFECLGRAVKLGKHWQIKQNILATRMRGTRRHS